MLAAFLTFMLHVLLIGSMLAFVACSVVAALATDSHVERMIRFGALFSGALVVLGTRAGGMSFSNFIAESLSDSGVAVATGGVVVPGAAGAALGLLLVRSSFRGNIYVIRIMVFIGTLAATQFAEIYVASIELNGPSLGRPVVPNISFVVGILLCIALTYDPRASDRGLSVFQQIRTRRSSSSPANDQRRGAEPAED
jgi:hypothetical protein